MHQNMSVFDRGRASQSFLNKYFSTPREASSTNGEKSYANGSSRTEPKRSHQWLNAAESQSFSNKKQAVEAAANSRPISGSSYPNISLWENSSTFRSGPGVSCGRPFGPEPVRTSNLPGYTSAFVGTAEPNIQQTHLEDQVRNDSQVHSCGPTGNYYAGNTLNKANETFTLMGKTINKGDGSSMFTGRNHRKEVNGMLPMRQPLLRGDGNFVLVDQQHVRGADNIISTPPAYNRGNDILYASINGHFMAMPLNIKKWCDNITPVGPTRNSGGYNVIPAAPIPNKANTSGALMGTAYEKGNSSNSSMRLNYNSDKNNAEVNVAVAPAATIETDAAGKKKDKKKSTKNPSNNFPTNIKSLLSTGILDGVPVKYISWARDKSLRGIIREGGYKCGCNNCKFSKVLSAYEFERHAGCKTKHPNNHIYFENGKSVYSVTLELQNTHKDMLFEAIQNVTGSPINQKNFSTWKASFQAANTELPRIYGKDGVVIRS